MTGRARRVSEAHACPAGPGLDRDTATSSSSEPAALCPNHSQNEALTDQSAWGLGELCALRKGGESRVNPGGLPGFCVWLQFLLYSALLFPTSFHGQNLCPPHCRLRDTPEQGTPWHAGRSQCFLSSPGPGAAPP